MDGGESFIRDVIEEGRSLGLTWIERLALILVTSILIVLGRDAWRALVKGVLSSRFDEWTPPEWSIPNDTPGNQPGPDV